MKTNWIDLGLPSGTLWKSVNEDGYFAFKEACDTFGDAMPTKEDFEELYKHTAHKWDDEKKGITFTGHNGKSIFLPAAGYRSSGSGSLYNVGSVGHYRSCTVNDTYACGLHFSNDGGVHPSNLSLRASGFAVRLVKHK